MRGRAECMTWCCFSRMPRMPNRCGTFSWRSTDLAVAGRRAVRPRPAAAGGRCSGPRTGRPCTTFAHSSTNGDSAVSRCHGEYGSLPRRISAVCGQPKLPFPLSVITSPASLRIHAEMTANGAVSCAVELLMASPIRGQPGSAPKDQRRSADGIDGRGGRQPVPAPASSGRHTALSPQGRS